MSNDTPVIPGADEYATALAAATPVGAVAPGDAEDPVYQALLAEIERGGTVLQRADVQTPAGPIAGEHPGRTVVARVTVDFVLEDAPADGEQELDTIVYPAVARDYADRLPIDAAVGLAKATLGGWEEAYREEQGAPADVTTVAANASS